MTTENQKETTEQRGGLSVENALLGANSFFKKEWVKPSKYPSDFIPAGAEVFIGVDQGSPDGDCTVKGFYKNGVFHVQEIEHSKST